MAYVGPTGHIQSLGIYINVNANGVAGFWCEEHGCTAIWNDGAQAFVVTGRNGELIKVKDQPMTPAYTMGEQTIYRDNDEPNVLWGAMWWA